MRILLISPMPPQHDGIGVYAGRLAATYASAGHTVAVIPLFATDVEAAFLGTVSVLPWRWYATVRAARRWRPDVVHLQHSIATYGPRLLAVWALIAALRLSRVDVVVTHHEVTRDIERMGWLGVGYYRLTSALVDRVHVHTHASAQMVINRLHLRRDRVLVRAHPVYSTPMTAATTGAVRDRYDLDERVVLLIFGYIHPEKGILEAVQGFGALCARHPERAGTVRLVVAGEVRARPAGFHQFEEVDRAYLDRVRAQVLLEGLQDDVNFVGHVPDDEVRAWFEISAVALLPYLASEQSGVANLAISVGTPVLATRVGGLAELFEGRLRMIEALDRESLADDLEAVLADLPALRERVSSAYADLREAGSARALVEAVLAGVGARSTGLRRALLDPSTRDPTSP